MFNELTNRFQGNPKRLFLIDGLGALLSAFLLGIVLVRLESIFGIPVRTLYLLASLPIGFALFDLYSFKKSLAATAGLLKAIGSMNVLYCLLSIILAFTHIQSITIFGWIYIILEVLIVTGIALLEFKVSNRIHS